MSNTEKLILESLLLILEKLDQVPNVHFYEEDVKVIDQLEKFAK